MRGSGAPIYVVEVDDWENTAKGRERNISYHSLLEYQVKK